MDSYTIYGDKAHVAPRLAQYQLIGELVHLSSLIDHSKIS